MEICSYYFLIDKTMCGTSKRLTITKSATLEIITAPFSGAIHLTSKRTSKIKKNLGQVDHWRIILKAKTKLYFEIENKFVVAGIIRLEIVSTKFKL